MNQTSSTTAFDVTFASLAVQIEPSSAPARDVLAKGNVALGDYASALSDFGALAVLCREQRPTPPDEYSIPAHFALHNIEQLDYILTTGNYDEGVRRCFHGRT
jgi:hypothetical protein